MQLLSGVSISDGFSLWWGMQIGAWTDEWIRCDGRTRKGWLSRLDESMEKGLIVDGWTNEWRNEWATNSIWIGWWALADGLTVFDLFRTLNFTEYLILIYRILMSIHSSGVSIVFHLKQYRQQPDLALNSLMLEVTSGWIIYCSAASSRAQPSWQHGWEPRRSTATPSASQWVN